MATTVGDIAIKVGADIGPLVTGLNRAQTAVAGFGKSAGAAGGGMRAFATAAGVVAATAATASLGIVALTRRSMESIDVLSKSARMLGIHTAELQAMSQVAEEAGVETEAFTKALVKMQDNIAGLSQGTAAQVTAFGQLGLSMSDLVGLGADEQFALIAERIDGISDPANRTAAALNVFGKAGADLIPMMEGYRGALEETAQFQKEFGISVSDLGGRDVEAANDAIGRMSIAMSGLGNALAVSFSPAVVEAANALASLISYLHTTQDEINEMAVDIAFDKMSASAAELSETTALAAASFNDLADGEISAALAKNVASIDAATEAFERGEFSADEYEKAIKDAVNRNIVLMMTVQDVAGLDMSDAIAEMHRLSDAIDDAAGSAKILNGQMPGGAIPGMHPRSTPAVRNAGGDFMFPAVNGLAAGPGGLGSLPSGLGMAPVVPDEGTGGGGGGGGRDMAAELEALKSVLQTEVATIESQYQERLAKLQEFRQAKLLTEAEFDDLEAEAKADHEAALSEIEDRARASRLQAFSGMFGDLSTLMSSNNEKTFRIGKAAAIAQAVVDGYQSATAAWKSGMKIGGPPVAAAFTAASLAKTGAMIAGIQRTQIGGGSGGSASGGGSGAISAASAPLEVRLTGFGPQDLISGDMVGKLFDRLRDEAGDRGVNIMVAA
jgi:DNA-binding phage protein